MSLIPMDRSRSTFFAYVQAAFYLAACVGICVLGPMTFILLVSGRIGEAFLTGFAAYLLNELIKR